MAKKIKLNGSDEVVTKYAIKDSHGTDLNQASLQEQITNLSSRSRFLSYWNAQTGLASTNPPVSPYDYKTGDYFIVSIVDYVSQYSAYDTSVTYNTGDKVTYNSATYICNEDGVTGTWNASKWTAHTPANYKPSGTQYIIGTASTTVESNAVAVGDTYQYDGTTWILQKSQIDLSAYGQLAGNNTWTGSNKFRELNVKGDGGYANIVFNDYTDTCKISAYQTRLTYRATNGHRFSGSNLVFDYNNAYDIGDSSNKLRSLYLAGKIDDGTNQTSVAKINGNFAPTYSSSSTYNVGDYVIYQGALYKCNTQISVAEAWTSAHWTATNVIGEMPSLPSDPATDGDYVLQNNISSGASSKSWSGKNWVETLEINSVPITQEQFNKIASGKALQIIGTIYSNITNPFILSSAPSGVYYDVLYIRKYRNEHFLEHIALDTRTNTFVYWSNVRNATLKIGNLCSFTGSIDIYNKTFPSYSQGALYYDGTNLNWGLKSLTLTESGGTYTSSETVPATARIHLNMEIDSATEHASLGLDLNPYDSTNSIASYASGSVFLNNNFYMAVAYLNSSRNIVIDLSRLSGVTTVVAKYTILG